MRHAATRIGKGFVGSQSDMEVSRVTREQALARKRQEVLDAKELLELESKIRVTEITAKDFEDLIGFDWKSRRPRSLDFSSEKYELESLHGPPPTNGLLSPQLGKSRLVVLDVSNNRLHDLTMLSKSNGFGQLNTLLARRNMVREIGRLDLPKLVELNLSYNCLQALPNLSLLPSVETLILSHNRLTGDFASLQKGVRLQRLDLAYNNYRCRPSELQRSLSGLADLRTLETLRLANNPFCDFFPEYQVFVVVRLEALKTLDDLKITKTVREHILREHLHTLDAYDEVFLRRAKEAKTEQEATVEEGYPRLLLMIQGLEEIFEDPMKLQENVRALRVMADQCAAAMSASKADRNRKMELFWLDAAHVEAVPRFMELATGLVQRHDSVQGQMIEVLAKLSGVARHDFGPQCMALLGRMMISSSTSRQDVLWALHNIVVPQASATVSKTGAVIKEREEFTAVVTGLVNLMEKPELKMVVAAAIGGMAPLLLQVFSDALQQDGGKASSTRRITECESVLRLLSISTEDPSTAALVGTKEFVTRCVTVLDDRSIIQGLRLRPLWLDVLKSCENVLHHGKDEGVEALISCRLHVKVILLSRDIWTGGSVARHPLEPTTVAACIDYVIAISKRRPDILVECCNSHNLVSGCCDILRQTDDPKMLTASILFITLALRSEVAAHYIEHVVTELSKLSVIMQYLGGIKYPYLYRAALAHSDDEEIPDVVDPPSLSRLSNIHVINAFQAIVELLAFFFEESENDKIREQKEMVNTLLNEQGREMVLMKMLSIPHSDCKVCLVRCLTLCPLEQFDSEEMGHLIRLMASERNLSEGRTEEMLALLIKVLERLASSRGNSGDVFRGSYSELALAECYEILYRNAERPTDGDDEAEDEKAHLSVACVSFLMTCGTFPALRQLLRSARMKSTLPQLLKWEEELHRPTAADISVEGCWFGRSLEVLIACLVGPCRLDPHKKVAFRVIARIADIIQGYTDCHPSMQGVSGIDTVVARETKMWNLSEMKQWLKFLDDQEWKDREQEMAVFTDSRWLEVLIHYVTNGLSSKLDMELRENLNEYTSFVGEIYRDADEREAKLAKEDIEERERDFAFLVRLTEADPMSDQHRLTGRETLMTAIQRSEDVADADTHSVFLQRPELFTGSEDIFVSAAGTINPAYRMAALLRAIHAAVRLAPLERCRFETVGLMRRADTISMLLSRMADVPVLSCHVGAKFLHLMSEVFNRENDDPLVEMDGDTTDQEPIRLELLRLVLQYVRKLADSCAYVLRGCKDNILDQREQMLCIEIAGFMVTTVRALPGFIFSDHPSVQRDVLRSYIGWVATPEIVRTTIAMILYGMQVEAGGANPNQLDDTYVEQVAGTRRTKESAASFLTEVIVRSPHTKYDVLEAFSAADLFGGVTVRSSFMDGLLNDVHLASYALHIESLLPTWGVDGHVHYLVTVWALERLSNSLNLCLLCLVQGEVFLLEPDKLLPPYAGVRLEPTWHAAWEDAHPRNPQLLWRAPYKEIANMYLCYGTQILALEWKEQHKLGQTQVDPLTQRPRGHDVLIFERAKDRKACMNHLRRSSFPAKRGRAQLLLDPVFRDDLAAELKTDSRVLIATVALCVQDNMVQLGTNAVSEPRMYVMTPETLREFVINLDSWYVSTELDTVLDRDELLPETQRPRSKPAGFDTAEEEKQMVQTHKKRIGNSKKKLDAFNVVDPLNAANAAATALSMLPSGPTLSLARQWSLPPEEVTFHSNKHPDITFGFDKASSLQVRFLDDAAREEWRRAFAHYVVLTDRVWERSA